MIMKIQAIAFLVTYGMTVQAQVSTDVEIIDISQKEIRIFNQAKNLSTATRDKLVLDSLFVPYRSLWMSYIGDEQKFLHWVHQNVYPHLTRFNRQNNQIERDKILKQFAKAQIKPNERMAHQLKQVCYIVLGPGCTDAGSFLDGTRLIDLMHEKFPQLIFSF